MKQKSNASRLPGLRIRVDFSAAHALGPGKVRLLELIDDTGSISAGGRGLRMSYRRAWLLVEALNSTFDVPLVIAQKGGGGGGGARLTEAGKQVVRLYRDIEARAGKAADSDLRALSRMLAASARA
jgi:molybdate transport system regulatory protein